MNTRFNFIIILLFTMLFTNCSTTSNSKLVRSDEFVSYWEDKSEREIRIKTKPILIDTKGATNKSIKTYWLTLGKGTFESFDITFIRLIIEVKSKGNGIANSQEPKIEIRGNNQILYSGPAAYQNSKEGKITKEIFTAFWPIDELVYQNDIPKLFVQPMITPNSPETTVALEGPFKGTIGKIDVSLEENELESFHRLVSGIGSMLPQN